MRAYSRLRPRLRSCLLSDPVAPHGTAIDRSRPHIDRKNTLGAAHPVSRPCSWIDNQPPPLDNARVTAGASPTRRPKPLRPSLRFEREAWAGGAYWVAGVDEVGCGPLAGPVAAAVVALPPDRRFRWYSHVRDSKMLSEAARDELAPKIRDSVPFAIGWASHTEIDRIGILPARRLCMLRAFEQLGVKPDAIISDALKLPLPNVRAVIHGDALSVAVGAASIVAKVARDALMTELCSRYPGYGFCQHKGYATPMHKLQLQRRGPCEIHRRSYAPVAESWAANLASAAPS